MGKNPRKAVTFSVTIKKKLDGFRFMLSLLSNLVNGLYDGLHNSKCTGCKSDLQYISTEEDELFIFNCLECSKNHKKAF